MQCQFELQVRIKHTLWCRPSDATDSHTTRDAAWTEPQVCTAPIHVSRSAESVKRGAINDVTLLLRVSSGSVSVCAAIRLFVPLNHLTQHARWVHGITGAWNKPGKTRKKFIAISKTGGENS